MSFRQCKFFKLLDTYFVQTKCVVIYHGNNNGGNNDYCGQRLG